MKFLLFESHLFVYLQIHKETFSKQHFIDSLYDFYGFHNGSSIPKLFQVFVKDQSKERRIEKILEHRTEIKMNLLKQKWWVSSMNNTFSFLDVILFDEYLFSEDKHALKSYHDYARNAMVSVILSAISDGILDKAERSIFTIFLASADLNEKTRKELKDLFYNGANFGNISPHGLDNWLFKHYLMDLSILISLSNQNIDDAEAKHLKQFISFLDIPQKDLEESLGYAENFLLLSNEKIGFLLDSKSYNKVYHSLSKRWTKILLRNKDKISQELKESKELVHLVLKSKNEQLTDKEKKALKEQFSDLLKSVPAVAIFMVPGGGLLLPIVMKLIPDLLPSSFRVNDLDEKDSES